jgi:hypothetical protein
MTMRVEPDTVNNAVTGFFAAIQHISLHDENGEVLYNDTEDVVGFHVAGFTPAQREKFPCIAPETEEVWLIIRPGVDGAQGVI